MALRTSIHETRRQTSEVMLVPGNQSSLGGMCLTPLASSFAGRFTADIIPAPAQPGWPVLLW